MSLRTPLIQIILLIVGLLVCSALPVGGLALALAAVRVLLLLVLGVALLYLGLLLRQGGPALPAPAAHDSWRDERMYEAERGA